MKKISCLLFISVFCLGAFLYSVAQAQAINLSALAYRTHDFVWGEMTYAILIPNEVPEFVIENQEILVWDNGISVDRYLMKDGLDKLDIGIQVISDKVKILWLVWLRIELNEYVCWWFDDKGLPLSVTVYDINNNLALIKAGLL